MNKLVKLAVIGLTAFAFTACNGNAKGDAVEEVALTALESGGYVVNVSSALLSEDDNFDIYFCQGFEDGAYYILNEAGDAILHDGSTWVWDDESGRMNIWSDWPTGSNDVDIETAGTVQPDFLVEGETYVLTWYDSEEVAGSMAVNAIETFDCTTIPMPL